MFVPSGTMANQIALRLLAGPGRGRGGRRQHVVMCEGGAAGGQRRGPAPPRRRRDGTLDLPADREAIAARRAPLAGRRLVFVENTHMTSGGRPGRSRAMADAARRAPRPPRRGAAVQRRGGHRHRSRSARHAATTVMCCLSKGLGAPVGSLLAGPAELIERARARAQAPRGAMRQAGIIAAAGLVALDRWSSGWPTTTRGPRGSPRQWPSGIPGAIDPATRRHERGDLRS